MRKHVVPFLKFAVPAAIIVWLLTTVDRDQARQLHERPKDWGRIAAAFAVCLFLVCVTVVRWYLLVRALRMPFRLRDAFRLGFLAYLLNFVSVGSVGGDLFKAIFLAKRRPGKRVAAVASVLVDRGSGLYGLLLLVSVALLLTNPTDSGDSSIGLDRIKLATALLVGLGTVVLAILVLGGRSVDRLVTWGSTLPLVGGIVHRIRRLAQHRMAHAGDLEDSHGGNMGIRRGVVKRTRRHRRRANRSLHIALALCYKPALRQQPGIMVRAGVCRAPESNLARRSLYDRTRNRP